MTIKLTEKQRDDLKSLLEEHQKVCDSLSQASKTSYTRVLTVAHEADNEFYEVSLNYDICKRVLREQKEWIEKELAKLGISV